MSERGIRVAAFTGSRAVAFLRKLRDSKKLFIRITERDGTRHSDVFSMAGINDVIESMSQTCGFSVFKLTKDEYRSVQSALNAGGYKAGKPDGIWGKGSKMALRRFQAETGLKETGFVDTETLKWLGLK